MAAEAAAAAAAAEAPPGVQFPFLCLLVSGGHNLLLVVEGVGQYIQVGTDSWGEGHPGKAALAMLGNRPLEPYPKGLTWSPA